MIISIVFLSSCELVVDVDVPYDGQKIVVNAVQHPDSLWGVSLSGTKYILEPGYAYDPINFADVVIHKPDGSTEKLIERGDGYYFGSTRPLPGNNYRITVDRENYQSVEGEMKMPSVVDIIEVEWDSAHAEDGSGGGVIRNGQRLDVPFTIKFADPVSESNYYSVKVVLYVIREYNRYPDNVTVIDTMQSYAQTYIRDPSISTDDQSEFSDKTFDGKTVTLPFVAEMQIWDWGTHYKTEVWLMNASEDFFKYTKTMRLQSEVSGDPFAQPVQVYSNMSNGFGIFSGVVPDVRVFPAPRDE